MASTTPLRKLAHLCQMGCRFAGAGPARPGQPDAGGRAGELRFNLRSFERGFV